MKISAKAGLVGILQCLSCAPLFPGVWPAAPQLGGSVSWEGPTRGMVAFAFAEGDDSISLEKVRAASELAGVSFAAVLQPEGFGRSTQELVFYAFPDPSLKLARAVFNDEDLIRQLIYPGLDFYNPWFDQSKDAASWAGGLLPPKGTRLSDRTRVALHRISEAPQIRSIMKSQIIRAVICEERAIRAGVAKGIAIDVFVGCTNSSQPRTPGRNYRFQVLPNGPVHYAGQIDELPEDYKSPDEIPCQETEPLGSHRSPSGDLMTGLGRTLPTTQPVRWAESVGFFGWCTTTK